MFLGYLFAVLAMLSIGTLGIISKLADRKGCSPLNSTLLLCAGAAVFMALYVGLVQGESLIPPPTVSVTGLIFGPLAFLAFWFFLYGLQFGKIATSWIFMNLSGIVPAVLSVVIYHERISAVKALVLGLVVASIILLWKDKQQETGTTTAPGEAPARSNVRIWLTFMLCAFTLSGICAFGLRILAAKGLAQQYMPVYLVYWYLGASATGLVGLIKDRQKLAWAHLGIGLIMALTSAGGQFFMGLALSHGVPGSVVFMLGMGSSMCVVVLGGVLFFRERVGTYAKLGIVVGLGAAVLLGTTG